MITRTCTVCSSMLPATPVHFHRQANGKHGLAARCKACHNAAIRTWTNNNREKVRVIDNRYLAKNLDKKAKALVHLVAMAEKKRQEPEYRSRCRANSKKYRDRHRERLQAIWRAKALLRLATIEGNTHNRIRNGIRYSLRQRTLGGSWRKLVPWTLEEFIETFEQKFTEGMSWERFIAGDIHIDHIKPVSAFRFTSPDDPAFLECWSLDNLQPLWALDNLRKRDRYEMAA